MNKKYIALGLSSVFVLGTMVFVPAEAKVGIAQREARLATEINSAYRANQLTASESDNLKSELDRVKEKEQKMKDKNAGRLSYEDNTELEKDLNKISNKLHKKSLEKRVQ